MPSACEHPSYRQLFLFGVRHGIATLLHSSVFPLLIALFFLVQSALVGSEYAMNTLSDLFRTQTLLLPFSTQARTEDMEKFFLTIQSLPAFHAVQYSTKENSLQTIRADRSHLLTALHQDALSQDSLSLPISSPASYRSLLVTLRDSGSTSLFDAHSLQALFSFEESFRALLAFRSQFLQSFTLLVCCVIVLLMILWYALFRSWSVLCREDLKDCHRLGATLRELQTLCFGFLSAHVFSVLLFTFSVVSIVLFCASSFIPSLSFAFAFYVQSFALMFIVGLIFLLSATFFLTHPRSFRRLYGKKI